MSLVFFVGLWAAAANAEVFNVSTSAQFQAALTTAADNREDDMIYLAVGLYDADTLGQTFIYSAGGAEQNSLTIIGAGLGRTILETSSGTRRVLFLNGWGNPANHLTVEGLTIRNGYFSGEGGGLWVETAGNITIRACEFTDNTTTYHGGGAYVSGRDIGNITLTENIFSGNTADHDGGGAFLKSGSSDITLTNNTFTGNTVKHDGGGLRVWYESGTLTLTNNTFSDNESENQHGGGASTTGSGVGIMMLINNTFSDNSAVIGGGICASNRSGIVTLTNNTFNHNQVKHWGGGGVHLSSFEDGAIIRIYNNIVWDNTANSGSDISVDDDGNQNGIGSSVSLFNNDYQVFDIVNGDHLSEGNNIHQIPQFVDVPNGDFHLGFGSPCVDKGDVNAPALPGTDFEGHPRVFGAAPDMGADEYFPDEDSDNVPDSEEMGPDGDDPTYDGNNDGIPDSLQDNVASFHTCDGENYVTLASSDGSTLANVSAVDNPSPADASPDVDFPFGFFEFTLNNIGVGGATTVTLYLPDGASVSTYHKYGPTPNNPTPHWYEFMFDGTTGAVISGNIITLHFVDGQRGDYDLTANGVIVDPGAPGFGGIPGGIPGDLDGDGDVDRDDLNILLAARNTPADGPDDPRDLDGDGMITALDARKLVLLCTRPRCACEEPPG